MQDTCSVPVAESGNILFTQESLTMFLSRFDKIGRQVADKRAYKKLKKKLRMRYLITTRKYATRKTCLIQL